MVAVAGRAEQVVERYAVLDMTCGACVRHVERALRTVPGVWEAQVDLATRSAEVRRDPALSTFERLRQAVAAAGYGLEERPGAATPAAPALQSAPLTGSVGFGLLGAAGLLGFYLGVITLAQGWDHALQQLATDGWFIGAIMLGFGTQVGLFAHLRSMHVRMSAGGVAASTSTSTAAMLACCAHHLADVLPVLGVSVAAAFLSTYKTPLLWLGIGMNLVGVGYLAFQVRRQWQHARTGACALAPHSRERTDEQKEELSPSCHE
jgi:copper chaperone CopZ